VELTDTDESGGAFVSAGGVWPFTNQSSVPPAVMFPPNVKPSVSICVFASATVRQL
jgi:hypothetical protein